MCDKRWRAFWKTLLFYAFVGPLVGLLSLLVISFAVEAWGPIVDRLAALMPHAPDPACVAPHGRQFDLRCYQRNDPRPFTVPGWSDVEMLPLFVFGAYFIGFIPASLAGLCIAAGRLHGGGAGFIYALAVGTVIGFALGSMAMFYPQNAVALFLICLISTIVCWFITRRWWRKGEVRMSDGRRGGRSEETAV
jgi:hypothetical protein